MNQISHHTILFLFSILLSHSTNITGPAEDSHWFSRGLAPGGVLDVCSRGGAWKFGGFAGSLGSRPLVSFRPQLAGVWCVFLSNGSGLPLIRKELDRTCRIAPLNIVLQRITVLYLLLSGLRSPSSSFSFLFLEQDPTNQIHGPTC